MSTNTISSILLFVVKFIWLGAYDSHTL